LFCDIYRKKKEMEIVDKILQDGEYVKEKTAKNTIYLHHTAGSHMSNWTIDAWNKDRSSTNSRVRIATAFVIGGLDRVGSNKDSMNGKVYRAFDESFWASHLGLKTANNTQLNKQSIGIEICNYGPLTKTTDGKFLTYVNSMLDESQVCDLGFKFRGYQYYHKYTTAQIESLKNLMVYLSGKYGIDLRCGLVERLDRPDAFEVNQNALNGDHGVWSHSSVRKDKSDVSPQPELIAMLRTLA
jgi:hypothetical protein